MSAGTSACFKNDHHTSTHLAVWSLQRGDTTALCCRKHARKPNDSFGEKQKGTFIQIKDRAGVCVDDAKPNKFLMKEFMMFEDVLMLTSVIWSIP